MAALDGIRVLDFGRYVSGPYCATLLADFGADVIRIERPGGGEDRFIGPVSESGDGAGFLQLARNKRCMTFNPRAEGASGGNAIVPGMVSLATHLKDPVERFETVRSSSRHAKDFVLG